MSVIDVQPVKTQQMGGQGAHRSYRSLYHVITDDITDGPVTIWDATRYAGTFYLPQLGDYYTWQNDNDLWAVVVGEPHYTLRDVNRSRKVWDVVITHTTEQTSRDSQSKWDNPLDEPWRVRLLGDEWTEEATTDPSTGRLIANSAGQPITGKLAEIYKSRSRWQLTKNRPYLQQDLIDYSRGNVNSNPVTIRGRSYAARTLLLRGVEAEELVHSQIGRYYRYEFSLDTNPDTFDCVRPDMGTRYFIGIDLNNPDHFTDVVDPIRQQRVEKPVLLDGFGNKRNNNLAPYIMRQEKYQQANLNVWQFPA